MSGIVGHCGLLLAGAALVTDPNFSFRELLLHGDGADGSTTVSDSSSNGFAHAMPTNTALDTAQQKFGSASILFNGSDAGLRYTDNAAFTIGAGQFLVEMFALFADTGTTRWLCGQSDSSGTNTATSIALQRTSGNKIRGFACSGGSAVGDVTSSSSVTSGVWYYIAYGRDSGNTFRLFIDAVAEGTASSGATLNDSGNSFGVGCLGSAVSNPMSGHIDEFRLTVGLYEAVVTVPTSPFPNS
jgi:hypothetical protein